MAVNGKIADLFIDLTLRGAGPVELASLKNKIAEADKALSNGAEMYKQQTKDKIRLLDELAEKQAKLAAIDMKTYGSERYVQVARKQAHTESMMQKAAEAKSYGDLVAKHGKFGAQMISIGRAMNKVNPLRGVGAVAGALNAVSIPAMLGMGVAGMTVGHAVQSASPAAHDTLMKSFDLLAATLGQHLIPAVIAVANRLQQMADAIDGRTAMRPPGPGNEEWYQRWVRPFTPDGIRRGGEALGTRWFDNGTYVNLGRDYLSQLPMAGILSNFIPKSQGPLTDAQRAARNNEWAAGDADRRQANAARTSLPATMPAQFNSIEQVWRNIQQQAASRGPLEERIMQIQERTLNEMLLFREGQAEGNRHLGNIANRPGGNAP